MEEANNNFEGNMNIQQVNPTGVNNINKNNKKVELKRKVTMNHYINVTLDNMGFTRYHLLLFLTNALFLFFT